MDHGNMVDVHEPAPQVTAQRAVQFHSDDFAAAGGEFSRQDTISRADLDYDVPTRNAGLGDQARS